MSNLLILEDLVQELPNMGAIHLLSPVGSEVLFTKAWDVLLLQLALVLLLLLFSRSILLLLS